MLVRRDLKLATNGKLYALLDTSKLVPGDKVLRIRSFAQTWSGECTTDTVKCQDPDNNRVVLQTGNWADNGSSYPLAHPEIGIAIEEDICPSFPVTDIMSEVEIKKEVEKRRLQVQRRLLRWPYECDFVHIVNNKRVLFFFMKNGV